MDGVVNEVPVEREVPPVIAAYQLNVPALAVAERVTVPASHRDPPFTEVTVGVVFIVANTAVLLDVQPVLVAST